jgi:hypothetical protein
MDLNTLTLESNPKPGRVTIAALDDDAYNEDSKGRGYSQEALEQMALLYHLDDPRHLDAWQRNIFET